MGRSLTHKILEAHRVGGRLAADAELELKVDQALVHDGSAALVFLQLESLSLPRVRTELAVCYVDHLALPSVYGAPEPARFLRSAAERFGLWFSAAGNGICHQVHAERFAAPGRTLLGADSHTCTAGGAGMLAFSGSPLEVSLALAGQPHYLRVPRVMGVRLSGSLPAWVGGKDVALELLRRLTLRGGRGHVLEFFGPGVESLPLFARFTVANLAAELGAWSAVFPSDERTRAFLRARGRDADWRALGPDEDPDYDVVLELDLAALEPLVALPSRPDRVVSVRDVAGTRVHQVCIGSCTNASAGDLERAAALLAGRAVHPDLALIVVPGSRQVHATLAASGALEALVGAGARLLDSYCGPCIGVAEAPAPDSVSLRSFSRNVPGRSGTSDARVYLAGPEVCAATALSGRLTDPRQVAPGPPPEWDGVVLDEALLVRPAAEPPGALEWEAGIRPLPRTSPLPSDLRGVVLLLLSDDVSTDHIVPWGAQSRSLLADVGSLADWAFAPIDPGFAARARAHGGGFVVAGRHYGIGSGHAYPALVTRALGVRAVLARSFARAHRASLVQHGVLPLELAAEQDYAGIREGDELEIPALPASLAEDRPLVVRNLTRGLQFAVRHQLDRRALERVRAGGWLARPIAA